MGELRAGIAVGKKDLLIFSRYRIAVVANIFTPLYQGVIPALLFGAAFAVGGHVVGLESTIGTDNLTGFIFLGGVVAGLVATAFWGVAMAFRYEMDQGTLEATWLSPTHHETVVIGRALGALTWFVLSQIVLFAIGFAFFGLELRTEIVYALPALVAAIVGMVGVAYVIAAVVLLIRDANFFVDCTNFLFATASGASFPVTLLPGAFQPVAYALPTTYALDLLRQHAIGSRPALQPGLEYVALLVTATALFPIGRWVFARAEETMRRRGMLAQY